MRTDWPELLEAVLRHLQDLKDHGIRYLPVSPETLAGLNKPQPSRARFETASPNRSSSKSLPAPTSGPAPALSDRMPSCQPTPISGEASAAHAGIADSGAKAAAMAELRARALACQKCPHLVRSRKNVVFGVGDIHSPLMFVGEAPGADEDRQGEPFVGAAGQLLTRIIRTMGFTRDTVYIANILKCRPDTPPQTSGNRKPTSEEMKTCLPYLIAQIELIQPKVMVALGATAVEGLLGNSTGISRLRGQFQDFRGIPVMPTFHPSYLLRSETLSVKRQVWEDMLQVLEKLNIPITEKQRNYFLNR